MWQAPSHVPSPPHSVVTTFLHALWCRVQANCGALIAAGGAGVAAIRTLSDALDPAAAAHGLLTAMTVAIDESKAAAAGDTHTSGSAFGT